MGFDGESDGSVSGTQSAVATDRERELGCGVAEARAGDDGNAGHLAFALDDGRQGIRVHLRRSLELTDHYTAYALEARLVYQGLQMPVEGYGAFLFVVLEE